MYSLSIIGSFMSVFILYMGAEKTEYRPKETLLVKVIDAVTIHAIKGKIVSFMLFLFSTMLLINGMGFASGIYSSMVLWILLASAIVLLAPFQKLKVIHLLSLGALMLILELLLTKLL